MDIALSFIKIYYFASSLIEYLESLFKSEKEYFLLFLIRINPKFIRSIH